MAREKVVWLLVGCAGFFFPLLLYVLTLSPSYIPIDSAEFTLCSYFLGVCHPPGFALYTLLTKVLLLIIPIGTIAFRANLITALYASFGISVICLILYKLTKKPYLSLLLGLLLATSATYWRFSISADVFTFNVLLISLVFFFVVMKKPLLSFLLLGVATAHFVTNALLLPLLLWYFWPGLTFKKLIPWAMVFGLPFASFIYLFLRMAQLPVVNWGHVKTLTDFSNFVSRKEFGTFFLIQNPVNKFALWKPFANVGYYLYSTVFELGIIIPPMLVLTLFVLKLYKDKNVKLLILSTLVLTGFTIATLSSIDAIADAALYHISKFYLASYVPLLLIFGLVCNTLLTRFKNVSIGLLSFILIPALLFNLLVNFSKNDYHQSTSYQRYLSFALSTLPKDSVVITIAHPVYYGARYEQLVNHKFTDLKLVYLANDKNKDPRLSVPELYVNPPLEKLVTAVTGQTTLVPSQQFILDTIARNTDKRIFIAQGLAVNEYFGFLRDYLHPYGMWWELRMGLDILTPDQKMLYPTPPTAQEQNLSSLDEFIAAFTRSYESYALYLASIGKVEEGVTILTNYVMPYSEKARITNNIGLYNQLLSLEKLVTISSKPQENDLLQLGQLYSQVGNYKAAISTYLQDLPIAKDKAKVYSNIGFCYLQSREYDKAIESYQQALAVDPNLEFAKNGLSKAQKEVIL